MSEPNIIYLGVAKAVKPEVVFNVLNDLSERFRTYQGKRKKTWMLKRFIVSFLFWTGVRINEFKLTKKRHLDLIGRTYYVPTLKVKRSKGEIPVMPIPLDHVPDKELKFWMEYFEAFDIKNDDYIISITVQAIRKHVKNCFKPFNVNVWPHMLRHSLGYFLAREKLDIRYIREVLRHKNIANTAIYTMPFQEELREKLSEIREKIKY